MATTKATPHDCPFHDVVIPTAQLKPEDTRLNDRVGRLEGTVENLTHNIEEVNRGLEMVGQQLNQTATTLGKEIAAMRDLVGQRFEQMTQRVAEAMDTMSTRVQTQTKPNWQVLVTIIALTGSLAAYVLNGHNSAIAEAKTRIDAVQAHISGSDRACGAADEKAVQSERHANDTTKAFKELDDKLQREYTLMQASTEVRVKALDDKLQNEFNGLHTALAQSVADNTSQITDIRKWRLEHAKENGEFEGRVSAKQLMIEDTLKKTQENLRQAELRLYAPAR